MGSWFLVGNWKQHGTRKQVAEYFSELRKKLPENPGRTEAVLTLPFVHLAQAQALLFTLPLELGAQTVSVYNGGAYTGEISATMLSDQGVSYTLVGHSERRRYQTDTSEQIKQQCQNLWSEGIRPILCFGESSDGPPQEAAKALAQELEFILSGLGTEQRKQTVLAYEPQWAIGRQKSADPSHVAEVQSRILDRLGRRFGTREAPQNFLYGGSVSPSNIAEWMQQPIQGVLVGSSALSADEFSELFCAIEAGF